MRRTFRTVLVEAGGLTFFIVGQSENAAGEDFIDLGASKRSPGISLAMRVVAPAPMKETGELGFEPRQNAPEAFVLPFTFPKLSTPSNCKVSRPRVSARGSCALAWLCVGTCRSRRQITLRVERLVHVNVQ